MAPLKKAGQISFDVDYVIVYRFTDLSKEDAKAGLEKLLHALARAGLLTEVREGANSSLLIFTKSATDNRLAQAVFRSRVKDWVHGVCTARPDLETQKTLKPDDLTEAERLRVVYNAISSSKEDGGAGITPKHGEWKAVEAIFPLHDHAHNKEWIKHWSTVSFLKIEDLDEIRNRLGEKIAFYFAFTQSYFSFLLFPAAFGFSCWMLLGHYSSIYAIVNGLWCVTFIEYWKHQEKDLSIRWGVKNVSSIQEKRKEFKSEKEVKDPITGEVQEIFPATKRFTRQLLQVPFALLSILALGTVIATCFGIEIFLSEIYDGPLKSILVFLPTLLLTGLIPTISTILTGVATRLNDFENWDNTDSYQSALTAKIFVLNFITSYLPVLLTAFVYVPFGTLIVPYLDIFHLTVKPFADKDSQIKAHKGFKINPDRLRHQVIYCTVTAQIVDFAMETIVPYVKRKAFDKYRSMKEERAAEKGGAAARAGDNDAPEEAEFLARVRSEAELDVYDVTDDLREMVIQFGHLSLFSVVWPLTACSFLINNWVELRSDAVKICIEMRRPIPLRADSIGSWLDSLGFLVWFGSITNAAIVYLFKNDGLGLDGEPGSVELWALLLSIFFSEHIYLLVRWVVGIAVSKIDSSGARKEHVERYEVRKRYLEESLGGNLSSTPDAFESEKITRESLEEDARLETMRDSTPSDRFWRRQRSWEESAQIGEQLIDSRATDESKKSR